MKKEVKVIIGANYGDEGKGLATSYFAEKARKEDKKCLNVLFNGGCQRGHTVETEKGFRHVYQHFGCGSHFGADTYFDQNFMVHPAVFMDEYNRLVAENEKPPKCYISPNCRVITFYDMFINQIREQQRGNNKHGSCGYGIWETRRRYDNGKYALRFGDLIKMSRVELFCYLCDISKRYLPRRLAYCGITDIPYPYKEYIDNSEMVWNYIDDLDEMVKRVEVASFDDIADKYDTIIFEGAQGLALDEDNYAEIPHTTASNTNSDVPRLRVEHIDCDIEIVYVTRTYFTRHGAGKFPTECDKSEINPNIEDLTNNPNNYQGSIRYGKFDRDAFFDRVTSDGYVTPKMSKQPHSSVFITHLNYTNNEICGNTTIEELSGSFDKAYIVDGKFTRNVKVLED